MKRNGIVELWRFLGIIAIALFHSYLLGYTDYHFMGGGFLYCDFFLILTGFYTIKHFDSNQKVEYGEAAKKAISYTVKKFATLYWYVVIAVITMAIFGLLTDSYNKLWYVSRAVIESTIVLNNAGSSIGALRYLSALLIVFPIFSLLCQCCDKYLLYIVSFTYVPIYMIKYRIECHVDFPISVFRVINGLCIGVLIYYVSFILKQFNLNNITKILLTIIEQSLMLFVFYETWANENNLMFVFICMIAGMTLMLSEITYTGRTEGMFNGEIGSLVGKIFIYLGKLSMIIFIIHMAVANIMNYCNIADRKLYIIISIVVAVILDLILSFIKEKAFAKRSNRIEL